MSNWLIKYKPTEFNEIIGQDNVINMIKNNIEKLPHMIFYGVPGTAKTSTIDIISNKIYRKDKKRNTLFLNASDERGIDTVRNKIKSFSRQKLYSTNQDNVFKFKLIILDEADSMTSEAQTALRRIMESYSEITRFCFICNYVNKIINPISSRCAIFRFKKINQQLIIKRLNEICENENCNHLKNIVPNICQNTNGDLRQSIIILESINNSFKTNIENLFDNDFDIKIKFNNFLEMKQEVDELYFENYDIKNLMVNIKDKILKSNYDISKKLDLLTKLNITQTKIYQNCDEKLQLYNFFSTLSFLTNL